MTSTIVSSIGSNSFTKVFSSSGSDAVSGLILMEDSLESSSQHLLNHLYSIWLPTTSKQHRNIWFLNFSSTISEYKQLSKKYNNCNFIVIDFYSDPFGWDNSNNNNNNNNNNNIINEDNLTSIPMIFKSVKHDSNSIIKVIQNVYNCVPSKFKENPIILINSISKLVLKSGLSDTCNLIRSLTNYNFNKVKQQQQQQEKEKEKEKDDINIDKKKIINEKMNKIETGIEGSVSNRIKMEKSFSFIFSILHTDLHEYDQSVQKQLQYISSVSIQITPLSAKLKYSDSLPHPYESTITLITKKRSGRVVRNVEYYYINNKNGKVEFDSAESLQIKQAESSDPDPTQNLSFNLKLTEDEKQAKESVVLPYRHQGNQEQTLLIEDPDDEDFDDEDPDDDLDI